MNRADCKLHRLMELFLVALALAKTPCFARDAVESPGRPNIVFILIDDLRWDALGGTGHPFVKTPNIDRIGSEGARFRNAFVTTPLCLPSRASFLTGQYPHTHGVTGTADHRARSYELPTFPRLLRPAGYETAFMGKWHIGDDAGPRPGFDRWVSFKGQGEYVDPEINADGQASKASGYLTDILTGHAVEFIQRPRAKPFLLYLAHKAVHAPFVPAERHKHLFADVPIVRAPSAKDTWEGKPVLRRPVIKLSPKDPDVHSSDEMIRNQLRCLMAVDEGVKRIFDALERTKQLDQTLIVFTSDHGYFWGEHDLGGKHGPYEEALRIPLLMRYPKLIKPGTTLDQFALSVDLAPTLLELADVPPPDTMQGRSLLPLLKGNTAGARTSFLAEFFLGNGTNRFPNWQAIRTERWKYIRYTDLPEMDELYDLQTDRGEMQNRIDDPKSATTLVELKTELERLLRETQSR
ncbi:MAG: sulfatase [Planctomycetaceae bacterium]|nr:sulfatase [Planctomycetaceae bacterium]